MDVQNFSSLLQLHHLKNMYLSFVLKIPTKKTLLRHALTVEIIDRNIK